LKTGGGSGVGGGTYCARACSIKTQAPKTTAHPLNKSCARVIRSNLLVGIAVSFAGDVLLPLIDHIAAKLSFAKPRRRDVGAAPLTRSALTPALSAHNREVTTAVVDQFRAAGTLVVFDPNMRFRLWSKEEARTAFLELAKRSDVLLPSLVDAEILCGQSDSEAMLDRLREFGPKRIAIKLGENGVFFADEKSRSHLPCFPVSEIDPVGAGDAFCAGVISGILDQVSFADSVRQGAAMGAFCVSSWGDYAGLPTRTELDRFLAGETTQGR